MNKFISKFKFVILIILIVVAAVAVYFTFFYTYECQSYECFQKSMITCDKSSYLNEEPEASWKYVIQGESGNSCIIDVTLLQAKQGELGIDRLNGLSMSCSFSLGLSSYPEKDLSKCNGRLKEELQSIIIKKLHTYILENLKEFDQNLNPLT